MIHANAPLSIEGRTRLIERCKTRPIAHVAAEMGISRACASKWVNRWRRHGWVNSEPRSTAAPCHAISRGSASARAGSSTPAEKGTASRARSMPAGRASMIHLDVKKVGRIPDGGGWRVHGRDSDQAKSAGRAKSAGCEKRLHLPALGHRRLLAAVLHRTAPGREGESLLRRSWPGPRSGSPPTASTTSIAWSPTTAGATDRQTSLESPATDPATKRSSPTPRGTTGRLSVTSASWPRNCSMPASSPVRTLAQQRSRSGTSTTTTTDPTAVPGVSRQPLGFGAASPTSSPHTTNHLTPASQLRSATRVARVHKPRPPRHALHHSS